MAKDVNKRKSIRRTKTMTEIIISLIIVAIGAYAVRAAIVRTTTVGNSPYTESAEITADITEASAEAVDPDKIIFENTNVDTKDKFKGNLILVNYEYQYYSGDEDLVSINDKLDEDGRTSFRAYDNTVQIRSSVYTPLSSMLDDFSAATGITDILIEGAYRTNDEQQALYDADLAATGNDTSTRVALPGHSEHECGYAIDFGINADDRDYDGSGDYNWINQNCWKYGFILRYAENKTDITQIQYESWHYRYVGIPHAYYMTKYELCLEEYIELLRDYPYEGEHLKFSDDNGTEYEIYYTASDDGSDTTSVPVPSGLKYEISGNNADGFIVTVYPNEKTEAAAETTEAETEATTEAETTEAETSAAE